MAQIKISELPTGAIGESTIAVGVNDGVTQQLPIGSVLASKADKSELASKANANDDTQTIVADKLITNNLSIDGIISDEIGDSYKLKGSTQEADYTLATTDDVTTAVSGKADTTNASQTITARMFNGNLDAPTYLAINGHEFRSVGDNEHVEFDGFKLVNENDLANTIGNINTLLESI